MAATSDVEMEEEKPRTTDDETERKKALLVYKSNQPSASDEEEEEEEEEEDEENEDDEDDGMEGDGGALAAAAAAEDDDDADVDDEEEGGVQVEKDDDESLNAPSDDDLDSTATPRRSETDEDEDDGSEAAAPSPSNEGKETTDRKKPHVSMKTAVASETDSASEATTARAPSPSPSSTSTQHVDDSTPLTLKSGTTSNVGAIIAARRRTGARKECEVCHEPRNGRRALLCAQCKCMYHSSCFRKQFAKLVHGSGRQWFCPDCEPAAKSSEASEKQQTSTPRKRRDESGKARSSRGAKGAAPSASIQGSKGDGEDRAAAGGAGGTSYGIPSAGEVELQRMTELALRGGKKINATVLERTEEMLQLTQTLSREIDNVMGATWQESERGTSANGHGDAYDANNGSLKQEQVSSPPPPPFLLVPASSSSHASSAASSQIVATSDNTPHTNGGNSNSATWNGTVVPSVSEQEVLLRRVHAGLDSLKNLLEQLQVTGIQFEVDLIKEIKTPPSRQERKPAATTGGSVARKMQSGAASGASARTASGTKGKNGASRLYSSKQIQKLEEWYQRSSRPESSEIQAMYRIINSPDYADPELQPEGISVKQIRIWFDNRRAKERLDYMRLKMKDISTTDMDADSVKKMKAAYIDEAKEVLEARVSRLRENGQGSGHIVDEADMLLLGGTGDRPLPVKAPKSSPSAAGKTSGIALSSGKEATESSKSSSTGGSVSSQKKRIRIDYVASVRKSVKDARDAGKSEEEIKALRTAAIERARERLHVPYKNARTGPSKPLGKDEVTHIKLKMLKLLEEDAPAEELTDVIELLLSLIIPRAVLLESGFQRQLELVLKAHKDNKELVRQTKKLQDEFQTIVDKGDAPSVVAAMAGDTGANRKRKEKSRSLLLSVDTESLPGTPGSSPSSGPTPSPDSRRPRVKFSLEQLVKLEKYFHKADTPSKKKLDKIAARLNAIAAMDPKSDGAQKSIDYKQIRCWFYKRRSANQPPQALSAADLHEDDGSSLSSSSSDTESDTNNDASSMPMAGRTTAKARAKPKPKTSLTATPASAAAKRKAPPSDEKSGAKRTKKDSSAVADIARAPPLSSTSPSTGKKEEAITKSQEETEANKHAGRIFNVKQLATIIEEYEKNPRPSVARLLELQKVLNQDDHADEHFANALGVTKRQIKTWFSNRRAKERLDLIKMKIKETRGDANGDSESGGSETEEEDPQATGKKRALDKSDDNSAVDEAATGQSERVSGDGNDADGEGSIASGGKRKLILKDDDHDDDDEEMDEDDDEA
ncbi:hypothetical protein BBJ28_00017151 [Nothophytophthora sp. Chile5]|nr:hypothetical protein BBJ28_00017151 [Nothophytophthora sp. Chile5]